MQGTGSGAAIHRLDKRSTSVARSPPAILKLPTTGLLAGDNFRNVPNPAELRWTIPGISGHAQVREISKWICDSTLVCQGIRFTRWGVLKPGTKSTDIPRHSESHGAEWHDGE